MKRKINLKWARSLNDEYFNFGDDLNPYIIKKLSGCDVKYIHFGTDRINTIKQFIGTLPKNLFSFKYYRYFLDSFFAKKYIIAIGSILNWYGSKRCVVWGAGIINRKAPIKKSSFLAVRGKYSKARLKCLGYNDNVVLGDPALLLPLIYSPGVEKKFKLGIVPHHTHYEHINDCLLNIDHLKIINLNNPNIEEVINEFLSCENIVSTSLHGLIVAHAYKIDSLWFELEDNPLTNDNVKFLDYFSSVEIPEYNPYQFDLINFDMQKLISLVQENSEINNINNDLKFIQKELMSKAPFVIDRKFLSI